MGEKLTYNPVPERQPWVHPFVNTRAYPEQSSIR
jgi:hypothetical protein